MVPPAPTRTVVPPVDSESGGVGVGTTDCPPPTTTEQWKGEETGVLTPPPLFSSQPEPNQSGWKENEDNKEKEKDDNGSLTVDGKKDSLGDDRSDKEENDLRGDGSDEEEDGDGDDKGENGLGVQHDKEEDLKDDEGEENKGGVGSKEDSVRQDNKGNDLSVRHKEEYLKDDKGEENKGRIEIQRTQRLLNHNTRHLECICWRNQKRYVYLMVIIYCSLERYDGIQTLVLGPNKNKRCWIRPVILCFTTLYNFVEKFIIEVT